MYYISPLTTLAQVLRKRDSSSLTLPMCIMNTVNGTLWLVYGLVLSDAFIWVPHGSGAILGALQTLLCIVFPRRVQEPAKCAPRSATASMAYAVHPAVLSRQI
jgi:solute carrier family 50 (sugar transporter)